MVTRLDLNELHGNFNAVLYTKTAEYDQSQNRIASIRKHEVSQRNRAGAQSFHEDHFLPYDVDSSYYVGQSIVINTMNSGF